MWPRALACPQPPGALLLLRSPTHNYATRVSVFVVRIWGQHSAVLAISESSGNLLGLGTCRQSYTHAPYIFSPKRSDRVHAGSAWRTGVRLNQRGGRTCRIVVAEFWVEGAFHCSGKVTGGLQRGSPCEFA